jgi:hypothetical protein
LQWKNRNNLSKNQKLALAGLTIFGVFVIGLWVFTLNQQIKSPLVRASSSNAKQTTTEVNDVAKQKTQDTDGDGLSDYDELNVYSTSPYIEDSDSDGISDGVEVKNGTNPNCPQGTDCNIKTSVATSTETAAVTSGASTATSSTNTLNNLLLTGQIDAANLRKILLDSGATSKADLDKITDAELLQAYKAQLASSSQK